MNCSGEHTDIYDLVVIGSGPAGQKGAISAAKRGKRVAIVERTTKEIGGVCLHTGTIPSKTMREAILYLTGYCQRKVYSERYNKKRYITMQELRRKLSDVTAAERNVIVDQLERNFVDVYHGNARFCDRQMLEVLGPNGDIKQLMGETFLIATGTKPSRPANIPFDGNMVFDSDDILTLPEIPRSMVVIGGGVIGLEYALMFAILGVKIVIVDGRERLLPFCDREIIDHLVFCARSMGITFRLGENVAQVEVLDEKRVVVELESKKRLVAETVFFSVGREGDTSFLRPELAGLEVDSRGKIKCSDKFETSTPNIFAVGDVIGFPSLASTSMEQGRQAVDCIYGGECVQNQLVPYGLYTIPEIAMVGRTEEELTAESIGFEIGMAKFNELARSHIGGTVDGLMKILFDREDRRILGVHCIGDHATEIIHIGQAVMAFHGTIDYLCHCVFNHPTIAEAYKVAALDGYNKLCLDCRMNDDGEQTCQTKVESVVNLPEMDTDLNNILPGVVPAAGN